MAPNALTEAEDPSTPAETLRRLAGSNNPEVLAAVAANPNVPPSILWRLASQFPEAVLRNPCFELLPLEDPLWLQKPTPHVVVGLMVHPQVPEWFVEQVVSGPLAVRLQVAARTHRPDLLWLLARKAGSERRLLQYIIANAHAPTSLLEHLAVEHGMLDAVLHRPQRPAYFTEAALEAGRFADPSALYVLAQLPELHAHQLERLASSPHEPLRRATARSPAATEALLVRLARDPSPRVREEVARHARCPQALARELRQAQPLRPRPLPLEP